MRIAEYKQTGTEQVTRQRWVIDDVATDERVSHLLEMDAEHDEHGHWEEYTEEIPVMGIVYRDATPEEEAEAERQAAEIPAPMPTIEDRIATLEATVEALKTYIDDMGKTVLEGDGSAEKPFEWVTGIELIPNAYYAYGGRRYVWMGERGATSIVPPVDIGGDWVEF